MSSGLPIPRTYVAASLIGGGVFGVGMALAGYCPGTIVAEIGEGRVDALVAGVSGLVVGAIVFGLVYPVVMPVLVQLGSLGRVTLSGVLDVSPWLLLVLLAEASLLLFYLLERSERNPA